MFNFTTQTVYNKISTSGADKNMWVATNPKKPALRIGNTRFDAVDVEEIQMKNPTVENLASVTFDMSKVLIDQNSTANEGTGRFVFYIGLSMNCQDSFYANDYVYKGKPLFIEFPIKKSDTAATLAKKAKDVAEKYLLLTLGTEKILNIKVGSAPAAGSEEADTSGEITFEGVNGYQIIKKAILQTWDPEAKTVDCCSTQGEFIDVITGVPVMYETDDDGVVEASDKVFDGTEEGRELADDEVAILPGIEAFGDYNWIIHNLRLPTAANYYPWSPANRMGEMPVVGQQYVQFIVRICKQRDGIMGEIVGARGTSVTTHVLYVAKPFANTVKTELAKLVNQIKVDADDKLKQPFA